MFWNRTVLTIHPYIAEPPFPLTAEEMVRAVRAAAATWSRDRIGCTSLELRVEPVLERSASVMLDGVSRVTFRRENWCKDPHPEGEPCYDPLALAVTSVFARKVDGEIVDADVELNAVIFTWTDLTQSSDTEENIQDLQNTLTHEFGHLIGLDHTCFIAGGRPGAVDDQGQVVPSCGHADDTIRATTMFAAVPPRDLDRRSLSPDDQRAVCEVYPPLDIVLESGSLAGCSLAARAPKGRGASAVALLGAGAAAAVIAFGRRRRRARPPRSSPPSTGPEPRR
jgi:hypothetical protein